MKCYCLVICVIVFGPATQEEQHATLSVHQRVNLLKRQLKEQIDQKQITSDLIKPIDAVPENYEYVDLRDKPITPIMNSDVRKKHDRFKLREIVTEKAKPENHSLYRSGNLYSKKRKHIRKPKAHYAKPLDTFYRRAALLAEGSDTPVEWVHCQDLVTPFFGDYKSDISVMKRLTHTDHAVVRFIQLLKLNTTGHTKEEIYSILYQISNLQVRLFHWDVAAINLLFNTLVKDRPHTLRNVVYGVRSLLASWHLDLGDTTNLLKQSRIFRPPCVKVSNYEGSTKTSAGVRYSKTTKAKPTCAEPGDDVCD